MVPPCTPVGGNIGGPFRGDLGIRLQNGGGFEACEEQSPLFSLSSFLLGAFFFFPDKKMILSFSISIRSTSNPAARVARKARVTSCCRKWEGPRPICFSGLASQLVRGMDDWLS